MKKFKRLPKWVSAPSSKLQQQDIAEKEERIGTKKTEEQQNANKCSIFSPKHAGQTQAAETQVTSSIVNGTGKCEQT